MFFRLFGNYLQSHGVLTAQQMEELMEYRNTNRVKLGILAVEQNFMTQKQADEVNRLQALADKRFGDIAVEKGYISSENLDFMIKKQGNPYVLFLQAVTEKGYLSKEEFLKHLEAYKVEEGYSDVALETIKNGEISEVSELVLHAENRYAQDLMKLAVRNLVRFVGNDIYFEQIQRVSEFSCLHVAYQSVSGAFPMLFGMACAEDELLKVACSYAKEEFDSLNADAYDAVCEFINCVNGLFARAYSRPDYEFELHPPVFKEEATFTGDLYLLPVRVYNREIMLIIRIAKA